MSDEITPPVVDVSDISADLESMDGDTYRALVKFPDGKQKRYTLGLLGYVEYNETVLSVPMPERPRKFDKASGKFIESINADYRAKEQAVVSRRQLLLLAASIDKVSPLRGATLADKADFLGKRPTNIIAALLSVFAQAHHGLTGRLEQHAASFHGLPTTGAADTTALEPDDAGLVRAVD